jgi:membrane-associated phospholipid phosphatase
MVGSSREAQAWVFALILSFTLGFSPLSRAASTAPQVLTGTGTQDAPSTATTPAPAIVAPPCLFCRAYPSLLVHDTGAVLTAPLRWEEPEWKLFARDAGIVLGSMLVLDEAAQNIAQHNRDGATEPVARFFEPLGTHYSFAVLGAFYVEGVALEDTTAVAVVRDGLTSSIIAAGIITPVLKIATGRSRPRENQGAHDFHPFSGRQSFPSGHTTQAFAVASVIAEHYESPWVDAASYGAASIVGYARILHNAHFLSDVLAGAMIGTAVGKYVVKLNQPASHGIAIRPMPVPGGEGIVLAWSF